MEVPQIQFIDAVVLEQFQFLYKFLVGPLLCNDSSVARGVQYIDNCRCTCVMQWQVCCMVLFCAMPGSTADTCSATALGALVVLLFLREGVLGS